MRVVSLHIGRPSLVVRIGRPFSTAINRRVAPGPQQLTPTGFVGDRVADTRHHGGPDRAVNCYPREHYAWLVEQLGHEVEMPAFGENLTTEGLLETDVCIGDTFRVGTALVQVSQPRQPCWKLAHKHGAPELPRRMVAAGFTGFYVRILEVGTVQAGDTLELSHRPHPGLTIRRTAHSVLLQGDTETLHLLAAAPELSASWHEQVARKLAGAM